MNLFVFQLSQQMPSEGRTLQRSAGAVSKGYWNLWTGTSSFCYVERIINNMSLIKSFFQIGPLVMKYYLIALFWKKHLDDLHIIKQQPKWCDTNAALQVIRTSYHISVCFQVAMSTMDNPLLKYNAKEYFFKASLCHFIVDELNAKVTPTSLSLET